MNPIVKLLLTLLVLLTLSVTVASRDVAPALKVGFLAAAALGVGIAVYTYRQERSERDGP